MGPAPPRRKPIAQVAALDKFAFVDASNYCVAEIDHNPLVTGRIEHVSAKHFIKLPGRPRRAGQQQQHDPSDDADAGGHPLRSPKHPPPPPGSSSSSSELGVTDSEVLALELPDLLHAKKAFEAFADEEYEAKRGEGAAQAGFLHAPDALKMDMQQFVDFFSKYAAASAQGGAQGNAQGNAQGSADAGSQSSHPLKLQRPPVSAVPAPGPAPAPAPLPAPLSASAPPPLPLVSVPSDADPSGAAAQRDAEQMAAKRRAALPYLFMRIDCDSDGFVTCERTPRARIGPEPHTPRAPYAQSPIRPEPE
jgi:hypothetical protein